MHAKKEVAKAWSHGKYAHALCILKKSTLTTIYSFMHFYFIRQYMHEIKAS